ncbi:MAG: PKD domain-containing protein, partial [Bacteroidales bacterium]|nr:PKD domain-containing protein [Bacteroidales bacterium]
ITGNCGENVILDAGVGYSSYEWEGSVGTQTFEVTSTGTYTVVVEDTNGCASTDDVNVTLIESPSVSVTTTPESAPGANNGTASVNVISGEPPYSYMWFNSNQTHVVTGLSGGTYCVTVTSVNSCSVEACGTVDTNDAEPVANFSANQTSGCDNLTVQFTDESQNFPTSWVWDFGDGETSDQQNPEHLFASPGLYTVSLIAENATGSDTKVFTDYIFVGIIPIIELSMTEETFLANDGTASVLITGNDEPYQILWTGGFDIETITGLNAGEYCVTVTGNNTCQASDCIIVSLEEVLPSVVDFIANQTEACGSLTVQFTDLSYYEATSWAWNFGDGGTSNEQNPVHFYASPGSYTVSLSIESEFGQDELEVPNYITVFEKPVLNFNITHESGAGNEDGQIELIITGGEAPYTINWSNNEHSLLIINLTAGLYSVAVLDNNGCMSSGIAEVNVITSISDEAKNSLQIYPNPTEGYFTIISDQTINKITIFDALGRVCVSQKSNLNKLIIDSNLKQGVYQVNVITDKGEFVKKLVVK